MQLPCDSQTMVCFGSTPLVISVPVKDAVGLTSHSPGWRTTPTAGYLLAGVVAGGISALIGGGHLVAWLAGVMAQRGMHTITMKANTALCLLLLGCGVALLPHHPGAVRRWMVRLCAALALLIGALTLTENLLGWNLGIDQLLAIEPRTGMGMTAPNRAGIPASAGITLAGAALLLLVHRGRRSIRIAQGLALSVCLIALLASIGYLYGATNLYTIVCLTGIAWPTAVALLLVGLGILGAHPAAGLMGQVTADNPGGTLLRRLLIPMILLPVGLGWVRLAGERWGWFDAALGTALMMLIFIVTFATLAYFSSRRVSATATALRASQQENTFLADLIRAASQPVGIGYPDGRLGLVNRAFEELTGYTTAELHALDWATALTPPEWRALEHAKLAELRATGRPVRYEKEYLRKDGTRVPIELLVHLVTDAQGHPQYYYSFLTDITERRKTQETLRQSEERLRMALDAIRAGEWELDLVDHTAHRSLMHDRIFGYETLLPQWTYDMFLEHVLPEDRMLVDQRFRQAVAAHHDWNFECRIVRQDKALRWIWACGRCQGNAGGSPRRLLGIVQDITARKQAEQTQALLASIVESSDDAIIAKTLDGTIQSWNAAAQRMFGYAAVEIIGQPITRLIPPELVPEEAEILARLRRGERVEHIETIRMAQDGRRINVSITMSPMKDHAGQVVGASKIIRDITKLKRAEQGLQQTAEELARSNKDLEQFAYVASHDLQEPLRMVTGYLQLIERRYKDKLDPDLREFIAFAVDGATRMSRLITDLLDYSRINTRTRPPEPVRLEAVLLRALENLQVAIRDSAARITHEPLPTVRGDAMQLTQLFQNLVGNALKFRAPERPVQICISAEKKDNEWVVRVQDNGIGIEPQYTAKIFLIFQRLHSRGEYPGTGIGLALCKKIVERHGGRIWVESQPGQGTTFFFTLGNSGMAR